MSGWVKYPFHVRHNGVDYNPGVPIEVDDVERHLRNGAKLASAPARTADSIAADEAKLVVEPVEVPRRAGRRKAAQ